MFADVLFTTPFLDDLLANETELRFMLDFESALVQAQEKVGDIPASAARVVADVCAQTDWQADIEHIRQQTPIAGNPAIPFVNRLRARVVQADAEAGKYVHRGATSQDVLDTVLMMQISRAIRQFQTDLTQLTNRLSELNGRYGQTPMMGRTLLQHALPITFGDKLTGWLDGLNQAKNRLQRVADDCLVLQLGGPVGTGASLGERMSDIQTHVAEQLDLQAPDHTWHTQRDRLNELTSTLGILNGSLGKVANDMILLMQTEVGEVRERAAEGKGGSSSMPHKRNPVSATFMLAIAHQTPGLVSTMLGAMIQPHERAAGAWHSEWPVVRQLIRLTGANLHHANELFDGIEIDTERMKKNMADPTPVPPRKGGASPVEF